jgi:hypothetical protein
MCEQDLKGRKGKMDETSEFQVNQTSNGCDELRANIIEREKRHLGSWFELAGMLNQVKEKYFYKKWEDDTGRNFRSFTDYCRHDLKMGSTAASDMVAAYRYVVTVNEKLIVSPSDGMIPGYNEIVLLLRAKKKTPTDKYIRLEKMLFSGQIRRDQLRQELRKTVPKSDSKIRMLEDEIVLLRLKVEKLESEVRKARNSGLFELTPAELHRVKKIVSKCVHPDVGGDSEEMKIFNSCIDKLLVWKEAAKH